MRLPSNAGRKPPFWDRRLPRRLTIRRRRVGRRRIVCHLRLSLAIVMVVNRIVICTYCKRRLHFGVCRIAFED